MDSAEKFDLDGFLAARLEPALLDLDLGRVWKGRDDCDEKPVNNVKI
jgi:hypothetical protein